MGSGTSIGFKRAGAMRLGEAERVEWHRRASGLISPGFGFEGYDPLTVIAEEADFGLRELDSSDRQLVGLEYWRASETLPAELLRMLPSPPVGATR